LSATETSSASGEAVVNFYGNPAEARQSAAEALKLAPTSQGAESEAALAFAVAGDVARAEPLAQDLGKRFPLDTQMQSPWLPAIQGQLALDRKNAAAALNTLQAASPIELGQIQFVANISCLYHVYFGDAIALAQVRQAIKGETAAAREMREAIEGRSITPTDDAKPEIKVVLIGADVRPQYENHAANRVNTAGNPPTDQDRISK
jgi:outer membrane PBP1 activator LpoA protein